MNEVGLRDRLDGFAGLAPGCQAAHDDKRVESLLAKQMRHTGAGGFALSSTVEVNVFVLGEVLDFAGKVIGLDANGALDSRGSGIVVTVAAHVDQEDFSRTHGLELARQFGNLDPGHDAVRPMLPVQRDAIGNKGNGGEDDYELDGVSGGSDAARDGCNKVAEKISDPAIRECVRGGAQKIQSQELQERHFHAARERWRHGVDAGDELGDEQGSASTFME